jgi:hypothetical protein
MSITCRVVSAPNWLGSNCRHLTFYVAPTNACSPKWGCCHTVRQRLSSNRLQLKRCFLDAWCCPVSWMRRRETPDISFRCSADVSLLPLLHFKQLPSSRHHQLKSLHLNELLSILPLVTECEELCHARHPILRRSFT